MRMGKHCFSQKPLTHTFYEARLMAEVAREMKVATQMGNQGTAGSGLRKAAAIVQAGALGTVKRSARLDQPADLAAGRRRGPSRPSCPQHLNWDLWLGPAPERRSANGYHPFAWRGWWDFGTGALGDMACHTVNMPFMALNLRDPISVAGRNLRPQQGQLSQVVDHHVRVPRHRKRPAVKLFWYDGGKRPAERTVRRPETGELSGAWSSATRASSIRRAIMRPRLPCSAAPPSRRSSTPIARPLRGIVRAIKGGEPAMSNFPDYAGPLTETVLLGNLAVWAGDPAAARRSTGTPRTSRPRMCRIGQDHQARLPGRLLGLTEPHSALDALPLRAFGSLPGRSQFFLRHRARAFAAIAR